MTSITFYSKVFINITFYCTYQFYRAPGWPTLKYPRVCYCKQFPIEVKKYPPIVIEKCSSFDQWLGCTGYPKTFCGENLTHIQMMTAQK